MKIKNCFLLVFLILNFRISSNCFEEFKFAYVKADGGLVLREEPVPRGTKVLIIPQNAKLKLYSERGETFSINGWEGEFKKVEYNGKSEFVFNGFLSSLPLPPKSCTDFESYVKKNFKIIKKRKGIGRIRIHR